MEPWFLDVVAPGAWDTVRIERDGRLQACLPYARSRVHGLSKVGLPQLARLLAPQTIVIGQKHESRLRHRFDLEHALIAGLPRAHMYEFVLPDEDTNVLAWQDHGFSSRIHHSFVVDRGATETLLWQGLRDKQRNLVRRAQDSLRVVDGDGERFARDYLHNLDGAPCNFDGTIIKPLVDTAVAAGAGRVVSAVDGTGRAHASVFFLWDRGVVYYFMSTRAAQSTVTGATSLLIWTGMCDAATRDLRFDFDGVTARSTMHYLQSFGGRIVNRVVVERSSLTYATRKWLVQVKRAALRQPPAATFA
jgi:hypothetical protein